MSEERRAGTLTDQVADQIERLALRSFQWLTFPELLEARFEQETRDYRLSRLWLEGLIAIVFFNVFLFANHFLLSTVSWRAVLIRSAIVTPISLIVNFSLLFKPGKVYRETSIALATCLICFTHLFLERGGRAMAPTYAQVGVIVAVLFANVVMRLQFPYALSATAVMVAGDLLYMKHDPFLTPAEKLFGTSLTLCAIAITVMANYSLGREERLGYLLQLRSELQSAELAQDNRELKRLSAQDGLTGLANRRSFDREYTRQWGEAVQHGTPLSAILIDVDRFKKMNDLRGHLYGDRVLQRIGTLLTQALRGKEDFVARFGGEEFIVLLPRTGPEGALLLAERTRKLVEVAGSPALDPGDTLHPVWATVSCGVATCWPRAGDKPEMLLDAADKALYQAKAQGRNRVCCSEMALSRHLRP